jgi:hypothetical protein
MQRRTGTFSATDAGGTPYVIEVWREVSDGPDGAEYGPPVLRWDRVPVAQVAKGAYQIEATDSPTRRPIPLTSTDPAAP